MSKVILQGTTGRVTLAGDSMRSRLGGLRSNLFTLRVTRDQQGNLTYVTFYGAGWGHGVGMCQSGAAAMAAAGHSYEKILLHYYHGVSIAQAY